MKNEDEVYNSLLAAKVAKRGEESKLLMLNDVIAEALDDIETLETDVEILGALELMLPWSLKKNTKCLLLLVKILVLPGKSDAAGYYCWIVLLECLILLSKIPHKLKVKQSILLVVLDLNPRLQKLVNQLEIHRVSLSQEDVNLKFLRSLPSEWKTHTLIWRNKANLEEHSLDDLFNSLRIYEGKVKHSSTPGNPTQNLAFVSSSNTDSTTKSTGRNLGDNRVTTMGFDMSKVECYNYHRKGHFARECRSPKDTRRTEEEPANFALMSIPSSSSASYNEVQSCSKACSKAYDQLHSQYDKLTVEYRKYQIDILSYQAGLESVEARLVVYKQNESILQENINMLKNEVEARDNVLIILKQKLNQAEKERDDLKLKFNKFQTSSKSLTELLANQTNNKHGLGYYSESDYESLSLSSLSDWIKSSGEYHAVPPPITWNFMPPKPDLVFHTAPIAVETAHSAFTVQLSPRMNEPNDPLNVPSFVQPAEHIKPPGHSDQPVEALILAATPKPTSPKTNCSGKRKNRKTFFVCKSVDHLIKDCNFHAKPKTQSTPRNYAHMGYNKQHASFTKKYPKKHIVPAAVLTKSKPIYVTAVRPVSGAVPKIMKSRPRHAHSLNTKSNSTIRRHKTRNQFLKASNSFLKVTAAKASVCNPQYALKDKGVIDSGCSRHMTGNMSYFSDFQELNGGYVAFGGNPKGGKILDFKMPDESQVLLRVPRENNMYNVNLKDIVPSGDLTCLFAKATIDESNLWHRRLGHINFKTINKLVKGNLVRGLLTKVFENHNTCVACKKGKQHIASCKTKPVSSVNQPLFRLHMDLFGPTFVKSLNKKSYRLVITDDYSRFTWVFFLATKDETSPILKNFVTSLENQLSLKNRVLVTKPHNKTLYELLHGRTPSIGFMRPFGCPVTILNTLDSLGKFKGKVDEGFLVGYSVNSTGPTWLFDIDSLTRTMNYQPVTAGNQTNPSAGFQETFDADKAGEEANQQYMLFPMWSTGSLNPQNKEGDAAFDGKEHDAKKSKSAVNLSLSNSALSGEQDDITKKKDKEKKREDIIYSDHENVGAEADFNNLETSITVSRILTTRTHKDHPVSQIISNLSSTTQTRCMTRVIKDQGGLSQIFNDDFHTCMFACFLLQEEPKRVHQALKDPSWIEAMQEELLQFKMQKVWILVDLPHGKRAIGINYEEVFAPVARIEAIRLFLAYASFMGFMVYQTDVKSAFLYETTEEEVYVYQPLGFEDPDHPDKVYKVVKALYGLHQAPRAWYETLANYLLENGFHRGQIDQTIFIKKQKGDILLVQIYVDDIIFVKQKKDGIFNSQDKYVAKILKKFGLTEGKSASTPIDIKKPLLKDPDGEDVDVHIYRLMISSLMYLTSSRPDIMFADSPFDLVAYSNSDYAGASLDRKSTTGGCQFLRCRLISWQCKKQTVVATSFTEAEYVAGQTTTGKEISNQFMAGSLPKTTLSTFIHVMCLNTSPLEFTFVYLVVTGISGVAVKSSNDVTRLQALVDKKKVVVTEAAIRDALHLDDAEGVDCLPNEEIFTELARMGYEKPSTKLTFYKAFFSSQWKVGKGCLGVETPLFEGMLVAREPEEQGDVEEQDDAEEQGNADNAAEEPITAASEDDVEDQSIPSPTPPTPPPQQHQDIPSTSQVKKLERTNKVKTLKLRRLRKVRTSQRVDTSDDTIMEDVSNQGRIIDELDKDEGAVLMSEKEEKENEEVKDITGDAQVEGRQADIYQIDMDHAAKVLSMQADEPEIQEAVDVVTTAKLITKVVAAVSETVNAAAVVPAATDPKEESSGKTPTETKSKDKGKGIMVEEPKPLKKKQQVELDEAYARKLHEELNQDIDWETKELIEEEENKAIGSIIETPAQKAVKRRRVNEEAEDVEEL
nr:hypothetical protein [Tanacetum cinerariifolium]